MPDPFLEQAISMIERVQRTLDQMMPPEGKVPPKKAPSPTKKKNEEACPPRYRTESYTKSSTPGYQPPSYRHSAQPVYPAAARSPSTMQSIARLPSNGVPVLLMTLSLLGGLSAGFMTMLGFASILFAGDRSVIAATLGLMLPATLLCAVTFFYNAVKSARNRRLRRYFSEIGAAKLSELSKLSAQLQLPLRRIQGDLVWLVRSGKTKGVYLDEQRTCLILDQDTYQQYLALKRNLQSGVSEQSLLQDEGSTENELVNEGKGYLKRIRAANDALPGVQVSEKLDRLERATTEIFRHVGEHPTKQSDVRKLVQYHLPTTLKLVDTYRQLEVRAVQGENIVSIKQDILNSLDMVNTAFERLLNDLYADVAIDVSSDISVLNAMLTQEGLAGGDDFKPGADTGSI